MSLRPVTHQTTMEVEVLARPVRRTFTKEYKLKIVKEADACKGDGDVGALLRREGLYSSLLSKWRLARDCGELGGTGTRKRGSKAQPVNPDAKRVQELERENRRLRARLRQAEGLVELQKKVAALFQNDPTEIDKNS